MRLTTYNNATIVIESNCGEKLLIDPWIVGDLYLGTWSPSVHPSQNDIDDIQSCNNVFISHLHMDHWDLETIRLLHPSTKFFLPNLPFVERVIKRKLEEMGFSSFYFISEGERTSICDAIDISLIKPLNGLGAEIALYESDITGVYSVAMDSGIVIFDKTSNIAHIFLCDNTPYEPSSLDYLARLIGTDFCVGSVFYPFNGSAQDYPVCYDNFTFDEKKHLVDSRNEQRNILIDRLCVGLDAQVCIPYSSDFTLNGPRSEEFLKVHADSLDREWSACSMRSLGSGGLYRGLLPGGSLQIDEKGVIAFFDNKNIINTNPKEYAVHRFLKADIQQDALLLELITKALESCRERIQRHSFSTNDLSIPLIVYSVDQKNAYVIHIDGSNPPILYPASIPKHVFAMYTEYLALEACQSYLIDWLENRLHFDNFCISCLITWHRQTIDGGYPKNLYDALNFFHI